MKSTDCFPIIVADAPAALVELCGVSILERLLRALSRLGFGEAAIFTSTPREISAHLAAPSWARESLALHLAEQSAETISAREIAERLPTGRRALIIESAFYFDARLLRALADTPGTALLADSDPPPTDPPRRADPPRAAVLDHAWLSTAQDDQGLFEQLIRAASIGEIPVVDVARQDPYLPDMRRHLRPLWFPVPATPTQLRIAERLILDSAQKGTLDIPARVHAPIETWIISHLCKTRITPMQITGFGMLLAGTVTVQFALGWLWSGAIIALAVGIIDGLDGKQARVKVQTTQLGEWEHETDYLLELSWWVALAWHFSSSGEVANAWQLFAFFFAADWTDRGTRGVVRWRFGRMQDDMAPIDRFFRLLGGRRNIYIWIFTASLLLGAPDRGFVVLCWWSVTTAAIHLLRAVWLLATRRA